MTALTLLASTLLAFIGPEPSAPAPTAPTAVVAGDVAPDFQYRTADFHWTALSAALANGSVILVIGADAAQIAQLQRERAAMRGRGVTPVAVLDVADREAWLVAQRLGVAFSLLADPRREIATTYGVPAANDGRSAPAWFVIDREGRVRGHGSRLAGVPSFNDVACASLEIGVTVDRLSADSE